MSRPSEIVMMDAVALAAAVAARQVSCVEVMTAYLDRWRTALRFSPRRGSAMPSLRGAKARGCCTVFPTR
jgi:Asp-tRNA(Asn)/Glu-tRNA(Gln) amidotransferase A subunit family amidase